MYEWEGGPSQWGGPGKGSLSLPPFSCSRSQPPRAPPCVFPSPQRPCDDLAATATSILACAALRALRTVADPPGAGDAGARLLLSALAAAEAGLAASPHSAPLLVGATSLYGLLGATGPASEAFAVLDVKNIQLDSLVAPHLLPHLLSTLPAAAAGAGGSKGAAVAAGLVSEEASAQLRAIASFHQDYQASARIQVVTALGHGSYATALDFFAFQASRMPAASTLSLPALILFAASSAPTHLANYPVHDGLSNQERLERSHTWASVKAETALLAVRSSLSGLGPASAAAVGGVVNASEQLPEVSERRCQKEETAPHASVLLAPLFFSPAPHILAVTPCLTPFCSPPCPGHSSSRCSRR